MAEPSERELELLKLFWREGVMSSREAQAHAGPELGWSLSTTRTVLERLRGKGLLERRTVHGVVVYGASRGKVDVIGGLLRRVRQALEIEGELRASAFSGSAILSDAELDELEQLINASEPPAEPEP